MIDNGTDVRIITNETGLDINEGTYFVNRIATEEEKQKLFDALAKEGKTWDSEKKAVVDLKWKPNVGDDYYSILFSNKYGFFPLCYGWDNSSVDMDLHNKGWVFRTREECEEFCNLLNDAINSVKP